MVLKIVFHIAFTLNTEENAAGEGDNYTLCYKFGHANNILQYLIYWAVRDNIQNRNRGARKQYITKFVFDMPSWAVYRKQDKEKYAIIDSHSDRESSVSGAMETSPNNPRNFQFMKTNLWR